MIEVIVMKNEEAFQKALSGMHVAPLVLDQKWHRLFAVHGKTDEIKETEGELNALLARQGKLKEDLKKYKSLKNKLMESIVQNMDGTTDRSLDAVREKKLDEDKRLIEEANQKMDEIEEELTGIPEQIRQTNEELMLLSMDYFYDKLRENHEESVEIDEWIKQVRIDLKKNIIRKQNRDINNREIYSYLHDIFGARVIDLFDIKYEEEAEEEAEEKKEEEGEES
jgi:hypothetical protein